MDNYKDPAVGVLDKDPAGHSATTRVTLRPRFSFSGEKISSPEEPRQLHERAHYACFIANSVKSEVVEAQE